MGSSVRGILQARIRSELPCPPPMDLPSLGIEPMSLTSPAWAGRFLTTSATWEAQVLFWSHHASLQDLSSPSKGQTQAPEAKAQILTIRL